MLFACCILVATVIAYNMLKPRKITDFCGDDISQFDKICIARGNNFDLIEVEKEDYEAILEILKSTEYSPMYFVKSSVGWSYRIQITIDKKVVDVVFSGTKCEIGNTPYKVNDIEVQQKLGELYESKYKTLEK